MSHVTLNKIHLFFNSWAAVFENRGALWKMKGVLVVGAPRKCIVLSYYSYCNTPYEIKCLQKIPNPKNHNLLYGVRASRYGKFHLNQREILHLMIINFAYWSAVRIPVTIQNLKGEKGFCMPWACVFDSWTNEMIWFCAAAAFPRILDIW